ncbi:hypothetical protein HBH70_146250 [Parastagonospora nodorum]|nr:hypothetical protein HBH53_115140 [Parastagonospora nodorum]KAH4112956.1 hypothetical protein HBH47_217680 [Parastagonospora nodorum]KAH4181359.1 hypothetical protein HBH42_237550 [Parastagonospora nodorum]KAH4293004.1 hypothetical protein HBI01_175770 [Parastagonospora nodorum]KAH4293717.1 hypothetical protein HBI02_184540 [Parastagonospora nodorum]
MIYKFNFFHLQYPSLTITSTIYKPNQNMGNAQFKGVGEQGDWRRDLYDEAREIYDKDMQKREEDKKKSLTDREKYLKSVGFDDRKVEEKGVQTKQEEAGKVAGEQAKVTPKGRNKKYGSLPVVWEEA